MYCVSTSNSMGSSEIWDKYHECCIEISIFNATRVVFIPNFTAIPMLFPVNTILDDCTLPNILRNSQWLTLATNKICCDVLNTCHH